MQRRWNLLDRILRIENISSAEFKKIEDEECRKISSLSGSKLFKYAENVTSSGSINRSFGWYYFMFCEIKFKNHDNSGAEAMIKAIKSILLRLQYRLQGMIHCTKRITKHCT